MSSALEKIRELRERRERAAAAAKAAAAGMTTTAVETTAGAGQASTSEADHPRTSPQPQASLMLPITAPPSFMSPASAVLRYRDPETDALACVVTAELVTTAAAHVLCGDGSQEKEDDVSSVRSGGTKRPRQDDTQPALAFLTTCVREGLSARLGVENGDNPCRLRYEEACCHAVVDVTGHPMPRCRDVNRYLRKDCIAQGVYGVVFSATEASTGKTYALKHIKKQWLEESQIGFPPYLLREFDLLMRLRHPNIVAAKELVVLDPDPLPTPVQDNKERTASSGVPDDGKSDETASAVPPPSASSPLARRSSAKDVFLVMEYCPFDLKSYMLRYSSGASHQPYLHVTSLARGSAHVEANFLSRVKCVAQQLFRGLAFMHAHRIMHRDIKTSNVLVNEDGVVKICDFGLGRHYREGQSLTPTVVTLMYRAPELHLGLSDYSHTMDVWSMGCVVAELFLKAPLFRAAEETQHLLAVCDILGIPTEETFPGVYKLPRAKEALKAMGRWNRTNRLAEVFYGPGSADAARDAATTTTPEHRNVRSSSCYDAHLLPKSGLDLFQKIFSWNPADRPSAAEVLRHPFFTEEPLPCAPEELTRPMPAAAATAGAGREQQAAPGSAPAATRGSGGSVPPPLVQVKDIPSTSASALEAGAAMSEEAELQQPLAQGSPASDSNLVDEASLSYSNAMSPAGGGGGAAQGGHLGAASEERTADGPPVQAEAESEWQAKQRTQLLANQDPDT